VLDGLWQLATDEREVLLLVAVEGLAYEEVATLLEVPAATVIARLCAARAKLRTLRESSSNDG
jgi:RNA polymerase sigma-70 factor, ECF subfamily